MELLLEADIIPQVRLANLQQEADELTAILTACSKKAKRKPPKRKNASKSNQKDSS